MPEILERIESIRERGVDLTADIYPYPAAMTGLAASLPPEASEGGLQALLKRLADPAERGRLRKMLETPGEAFERIFDASGGPEGLLIVGVKTPANRAVQGKRLSEIAADRHVDAIDAMFDLLLQEGGTIDTIYFSMSEEDVRKALVAPFVSFDCDAAGVRPDGTLAASLTHPRAYGTFPRVLGRYVRETRLLPLEEAVRKMTSLPARRIGLTDRGLVRAGLFADLTVFDPAKVIDRATFEAPHQLSEGIVHVIVNGRPVLESGKPTGALPGRILRGPGYKPGGKPAVKPS
jgi:N-acyl-D-aspartate/D-glutamate deacylase